MQMRLPQKDERITVEIPWSTFLRGTGLLLLLLITYKLVFLIGLILISILLAVTLDGVMAKLQAHGVNRRPAFYGILTVVLLSTLLMFTVGISIFSFISGCENVGRVVVVSTIGSVTSGFNSK